MPVVTDLAQVGELRQCCVTGRWSLVPSPERRERGEYEKLLNRETRQYFKEQSRRSGACPFCKGWFDGEKFTDWRRPNEALGGYYQNRNTPDWNGNWDAFAIRNAAQLLPEAVADLEAQRSGEVLFEKISGIGYSEVIVESPGEHQVPSSLRGRPGLTREEVDSSPSKWSPDAAHPPLGVLPDSNCKALLRLLQDRYNAIRQDRRIRYISMFRNHRPESGGTLEHPHSQIIASPIVPAQVTEEMAFARRPYEEFHGRCVVCALLRAEQTRNRDLGRAPNGPIPSASRVVRDQEDESFMVLHPFSSSCPFETWIIPKAEHRSSFGDIGPAELESLAHVLTWTLGRLYICLDDPAYNMVFKSSPIPAKEYPRDFGYYHWYIVIQPQRLTVPGGYELSTRIPVNPTPPEGEGSANFFRNRGVLFERGETKTGTLLWYQQQPTETEKRDLKITADAKARTLKNIVTILRREADPSRGVSAPEDKLTDDQSSLLNSLR